MALGAGRALVLRMVFTEASRLTAIGMVAGMVIGLVAVRATASFLYGLQPRDPLTLVVAGVALATAAAAASYLPARNAAAIDPIVALREE
jgi:ABC-type antimicrobial peptide transport system permease subunit